MKEEGAAKRAKQFALLENLEALGGVDDASEQGPNDPVSASCHEQDDAQTKNRVNAVADKDSPTVSAMWDAAVFPKDRKDRDIVSGNKREGHR